MCLESKSFLSFCKVHEQEVMWKKVPNWRRNGIGSDIKPPLAPHGCRDAIIVYSVPGGTTNKPRGPLLLFR